MLKITLMKSPLSVKYAKDKADEIAAFEALKAIKYAKAFNPQPILEQIKNSPNNVIRNFTDKEELFNIIFEKSVFSAERQAASEEFMKVEIEELEKIVTLSDDEINEGLFERITKKIVIY